MADSKKTKAEKTKPKEQYLKIPYHILNIRALGLAEKVLLAHIYGFGKNGCWQSNETLADVFMTNPRTVRRWQSFMGKPENQGRRAVEKPEIVAHAIPATSSLCY